MAPLPYSRPGAQIAFDAVLVVWVLLEWRIALRSHFNRQGARADRRSLLVVLGCVYAGVGGAFALAGTVHAGRSSTGGGRSSSSASR